MARVLFYLPLPRPDRKHYAAFHRGVGQVAAVLRREGHEVTLRMPFSVSEENVRADCRAIEPDALFVSLATPQSPALRPIAQAAEELGKPLLVGGPHPTFAAEEVLSVPGVTAICRGEGESAAAAFAGGASDAPGLVFPGQARSLGALADLSSLPIPDRDVFFDCPDFTMDRSIIGHEFAASRGCPFRCTYCSSLPLRESYGDAYLRRLPVPRVIEEVQAALARDPNVKILGFHDDVFTLDLPWLAEFAEAWRRSIRLPFWVNTHPALLSADRVKLLARAGCARVHVGIESGSEELRQGVLGRAASNRTILDAAERLKRSGIRVITFIMLGIPGETEASYRETVAILRQIRPAWIIQSFYLPLPGTSLGEASRSNVPVNSWEEVMEESFYLEPSRSWAPALSPGRLREMGSSLLTDVYEQ